MALSEIYVDPSIAADSGAGTIGDPYGDLEYAIEQETFDATNGTRINIKAGTDEVLAAKLETALADTSVSIAWAPGRITPLIIQGYTAAAGDGGIGGISGGGAVGIFDDGTIDYLILADLHLHNTGANPVVDLDNDCALIRCELDTSTGNTIVYDNYATIIGCYLHGTGGSGIAGVTGGYIAYNYITGNTAKGINAPLGSTVHRNIISIAGACDGINPANGVSITNNSIYSDGGTGQGITNTATNSLVNISNNLVEGFSGAGGIGIQSGAASSAVKFYSGNAVYNCENEYTVDSLGGQVGTISGGDNETLTASPFTSASTGDFSPVDTGNVKEGALPQIIGGGHV